MQSAPHADSSPVRSTSPAERVVVDDLFSIDVPDPDADGCVIVSLEGEVDFVTASALRTVLLGCLTRGCSWIRVDVRAVTFLNSAGLTVLADAHERAQAAGVVLTIEAAGRLIRRSLRATGLEFMLAPEDEPRSAG